MKIPKYVVGIFVMVLLSSFVFGDLYLNTQSGNIYLNSSGNTIVTVNSSGYVGIGTLNPTSHLVVLGNISVPDVFFVDNTSKRVGIGTTSPDTKVKIIGDINLTGTVWSQGINLSSSGAGGWTDDGSTVRLSTAGDNVGIGVSSTEEKLHVEGNSTITGNLVLGGNLLGPESGGVFGGNGIGWVKNSNLVTLSTTTDLIGIGTNNPTSKLHIVGNVNITGNISLNGNYSNIFNICPSGFTSVEAAGRQMGCIQNIEEGSDTCQNAILDCFDTYGGRLPNYNELYISFSRYTLTDDTDDIEWTNIGFTYYNGGEQRECGGLDGANSLRPEGTAYGNTLAYRCWIEN